jgi:hypothetical protein
MDTRLSFFVQSTAISRARSVNGWNHGSNGLTLSHGFLQQLQHFSIMECMRSTCCYKGTLLCAWGCVHSMSQYRARAVS